MSKERFTGKCPKCGGECQCIRSDRQGAITRCAYCKEPSLTIDFKEVKPSDRDNPIVSCPHCEVTLRSFDWPLFNLNPNRLIACAACDRESEAAEWLDCGQKMFEKLTRKNEVKPRVSCPHCECESPNVSELEIFMTKQFENHHIVCGYCGKQSKASEWVERKPKETPAVETKYCTGCGLGKQRPWSSGICQVTCATCGRTAPWEDWSGTPKSEPPPLGLMPRRHADEYRRLAIQEAIQRYASARKKVPAEWIDEWAELVRKLGDHKAVKIQWKHYSEGFPNKGDTVMVRTDQGLFYVVMFTDRSHWEETIKPHWISLDDILNATSGRKLGEVAGSEAIHAD